MLTRKPSARKSTYQAISGKPQLTLAKIIVFTEAALVCFVRPLAVLGLFLALAWGNALTNLYPWAHLIALALFIVAFFEALGKARAVWRAPSPSEAKRRVESASGLQHRPLDVLEDRPVTISGDAHSLWQLHLMNAREQVKNLRWPRWNLNFAHHDRYRLRYVLMALLALGLVTGWGALGGRLIAAINPALGKLPLSTTTIDAWITPPAYTHLPPIMIATPAGDRFQNEVIKVPEGSVLHAHLAERDGTTPVLEANNQETEFSAEDDKDFGVTQTLNSGDSIAIHRGWMTLSSWKVRVVPDTAPEVAFTDAPSATERKDVRIAYDAKDDYGVISVALRITPRASIAGLDGDPVELPLSATNDKDVKRVDFKNLTAEAWAGLMVDMQLVATDEVGHTAFSDKIAYTLPERTFVHPIARALIEERKKLLQNIFDPNARAETANLMAGVAKQPQVFGGDPLIMMALRAGAVRLVLDHDDREAALSAKDILWQSATRIEDGVVGLAEQNLHQAQQELADALDHNASEKEIQTKIERLHQALAKYLAQLSTRMAAHPPVANDMGRVMGSRTNTLTPQDLERMLNDMKSLSASGERSAAREELSKLQQILENMKTEAPQLTAEQQAALENFKTLHQLTKDQQQLLDETFQKAQSGDHNGDDLAKQQAALKKRLQDLTRKVKKDEKLDHSADAMDRAEKNLKQGGAEKALSQQNEALKALRDAEQAAAAMMRESMSGTPMGEGSGNPDPFGRDGGTSLSGENSNVHVPDHAEALRVREILNEIQQRASDSTRPKTERDYIERLLQNF